MPGCSWLVSLDGIDNGRIVYDHERNDLVGFQGMELNHLYLIMVLLFI